MSENNNILNKAKYLWNDFLKIGKRSWDLGVDIVTFGVQLITFWEWFWNTGIAKKVGMFLSNLKFK